MKTFYITFGFGQKLRNGELADNCYTTIQANCLSEARQTMLDEYGTKWAFIYSSAEKAGVDKFDLKYVPFGG